MTHRLISAHQYSVELEQAIDAAKERIVIASMVLFWDEATAPLFTAVEAALRRGVAVHIVTDAYIHFLLGTQLASEGKLLQAHRMIKNTDKKLQLLKTMGAKVSILGQLGLNPYKKRFHQKFAVIDDHAYYGGGVNLSAGSFQLNDFMLHTTNRAIGDTLIQQLKAIINQPIASDQSYTFGDLTIHSDGGQPHQSRIYDRALTLAKEADKITFVSQYCPSGNLAKTLKAKHAECFFNRTSELRDPSAFAQIVDQTRYRIKNHYEQPDYIHAKYILYTMLDGQKRLLTGSHNFNQRGVDYGTKELTIESSDPVLWNELERFTNSYIR